MDTITPKQLQVLRLIEAGHATVKELATEVGVSIWSIHDRAAALRDKGLVTATPVPTTAGGRPRFQFHRTEKPVPPIAKRAPRKRDATRLPKKPQVAPPDTWRPPRAPATPTKGVFDNAPRLTLDADHRWGTATREHVELAARKAIASQPQHAGRQAITARHLANLTGMPYLDALGALYRITERQTGGIRVYEPEGKSATFYVGPKYRPAFGQRA